MRTWISELAELEGHRDRDQVIASTVSLFRPPSPTCRCGCMVSDETLRVEKQAGLFKGESCKKLARCVHVHTRKAHIVHSVQYATSTRYTTSTREILQPSCGKYAKKPAVPALALRAILCILLYAATLSALAIKTCVGKVKESEFDCFGRL